MTASRSEPATQHIKGPSGSTFAEVEGWAQLPPGWTYCDVPGIATDADNRVYVLTRGQCPRSSDHPVIVFESDGSFVRAFGDGLFTMPHAIAVGIDGLVYCADTGGHVVHVFTPHGERVRTLGTGLASDTGYTTDYRTITHGGPPFNQPTKLVTGPQGELFASDGYGNARVHHFTPTGDLLTSWGKPGAGPGAFNLPHSVLVLGDGRLLVCDRENGRIQVFDVHGKYLTEWGDLARPNDVCVDDEGHLYVAELGEQVALFPFMERPWRKDRPGRVSILDLDGRVLARWGDAPDTPVSFFAPHGIAVDHQGSVYVAEVREAAGADPAEWQRSVRKLARLH